PAALPISPAPAGVGVPGAPLPRVLLADPRAAEHDDRRVHMPAPQGLLGLRILELEAYAPRRVAEQVILVERRESIGRRVFLRRVRGRAGILLLHGRTISCRHRLGDPRRPAVTADPPPLPAT